MSEERKPVAWVPCGDIQFEEQPPAWHMLTTSEDQVKFWIEACFLRVRPIYLGDILDR